MGAFASRYGSPGEYDEGRYGTPLIARVNGIGERISVRAAFGNWMLMAEEGLAGQSNKAGAAVTPDVWNDFANPSEGTSFVAHGHLGARGYAAARCWGCTLARLEPGRSRQQRGGRQAGIEHQPARTRGWTSCGGDLRVTAGRFGHLYVAGRTPTPATSRR